MRFPLVALMAVLLAGCAGNRIDPSNPWQTQQSFPGGARPKDPVPTRPIVTPSNVVTGRIRTVNPNQGYVVISFPIGAVPPAEHRLNVYRDGLKVAELKMTAMQIDFNAVADIAAGECQAGDEVREN